MERDAQNATRPGSATGLTTEAPTQVRQERLVVNGEPVPPLVLNHRFELLERLGKGGMGVVYKALDYRRRKNKDPIVHVALKVISDEIRQHPDAVLALQREFSRTLQLTHPNIVRTYDFDTDEEQNISFLTMELLQGESLDGVIERYPEGLPPDEYVPLVDQLLSGLECAHTHGVVHSDLKPSNIFITRKKEVKIMDFGIAAPLRPLGDPGPGTLFDPRKLGALSPSHASLEMFAGMSADPRDDIYSLGCLVYQMVSGHHPFNGARAPLALEDRMPVRPVHTLSGHANEAMRGALEFQRADRIASVAEFRRKFFEPDSAPVPQPKPNRLRGLMPVAVGVVVAVVLTLIAWQLNFLGDAPAVKSQPATPQALPQNAAPMAGAPIAVAPVAGANVAPAATKDLSTDEAYFEEYCSERPSRALLEGLLERGLAAQADLAFASTDGMREEATRTVKKSADCIRALSARQISTMESRTWLADADAILKKSGK
jgi:hypothetical protein